VTKFRVMAAGVPLERERRRGKKTSFCRYWLELCENGCR